MSLTKLPPELMEEVVSPFADEYKMLRNLRLASKITSDTATSHLFSTAFLFMHPDSWKKLANIAKTPYLAQHVREIHLDRTADLMPWYAHRLPPIMEKDQPPCSGLEYYNLEKLRQRFKYWEQGEVDLRLSAYFDHRSRKHDIPRFDLSRFPHLKCVSTVRPSSRLESHEQRSRLVLESVLNDDGESSSNSHLLAFAEHCDQLVSLRLHCVKEVQIGCDMVGIELFQNLQSLILDFSNFSKRDRCDIGGPYGKPLAKWLFDLPKLQSFGLIENTDNFPSRWWINALQGVKWPRITELKLINTPFSTPVLKRFLQFRRESLRSLTIQGPIIEAAADWEDMKTELADWGLDKLDLGKCRIVFELGFMEFLNNFFAKR